MPTKLSHYENPIINPRYYKKKNTLKKGETLNLAFEEHIPDTYRLFLDVMTHLNDLALERGHSSVYDLHFKHPTAILLDSLRKNRCHCGNKWFKERKSRFFFPVI